jgi:hypothetical protein
VQERVVQDIPNIHCIVKRQTGPSQHNVFLYDAFGHGLPAPLAILKD